MKYFITGGAGFIGCNYIEYLFENVKALSSILIFDDFTYAANKKNYEKYIFDSRLKTIKSNIQDISVLKRAIQGCNVAINLQNFLDYHRKSATLPILKIV